MLNMKVKVHRCGHGSERYKLFQFPKMSPLGMTCLVLLALANVCLLVPDHRQEEAFLAGLGLSHMKDVFREQEVRVEMIPHLDNATLSSLGFATIGARFNARASARAFVYVEQEEQGQEEQEQEEQEVQRQEVQMQEGRVQEVQVEEGQVEEGQVEEGQVEEGLVEEGQVEEGQEQEEIPTVNFVEIISRQNKVHHYFLAGFFKFKRKKVFKSGKAQFYCAVEGCKANLKAEYSSKDNQNSEEPIPDLSSLTPPCPVCDRQVMRKGLASHMRSHK